MLTLNQVKESLPVGSRGNITQHMVNQLNSLANDPEEARYIRDNFISFTSVLLEGRFRLGDYVHAVMYVSYKIMGKSNIGAYKATFPTRYSDMVAKGKKTKDIASIVSAYNKGMLVTKITEMSTVPSWILNQDMFQKALQVQYEIMTDVTESGHVRTKAASSLLETLKKPEIQNNKHQLEITMNKADGMQALEDSIAALSAKQLKAIKQDDMSAKDIAEMRLVEHQPIVEHDGSDTDDDDDVEDAEEIEEE